MTLTTLITHNVTLRAELLAARRALALAYGLPTEDAMPIPSDDLQFTAHQWITLHGGAWWNRTFLRQIERRLARLFRRPLVPGQRVIVALRAWNRDVLCLRRARVVEQDGEVVTLALRGADGTVYRRVQRCQVRAQGNPHVS